MAEEQNVSDMNIYQKLANVRKRVEVVKKDKRGYGYTYVNDDTLLAKISGMMEKMHISLIPTIVPNTFKVSQYDYSKVKIDKETKTPFEEPVHEMLVTADMVFRWINNDDPADYVDVPWAMTGHQSDASQSFGSALTYAYRYFLLKYFGVATPDDDPDNWRAKQREADEAEDRAMAGKIIKSVDDAIKSYLASNPSKSSEVKEFVSKYAAKGNYFAITEPTLAAKLLEDFTNKYVKG